MTFLLDVNVLIALLDPAHVSHATAHSWFARDGHTSWATCPITENGVIRIIGNPRYPNSPGSPAAVASLMQQLCSLSGHVFWPGSISLLDANFTDASRILAARQVTDTYLLSLATACGGQLATLDTRIPVDASAGGRRSLHVIR